MESSQTKELYAGVPQGTGRGMDGAPHFGQALRRNTCGDWPAARTLRCGIEAPGSAFVCWLVSLHTALVGSADFLTWNSLFFTTLVS